MDSKDIYADGNVLTELRFGFLHPYPVAGMGEPWSTKIEQTQKLLKSQGIGAILTLTEDDLYGGQHREAGFLHHHEPIDDCEPPTIEGMNRAIRFINVSVDGGIGVAVHCIEGRGRTGTVLAGWLGVKESLNSQDAINRINELRHHTVLTPIQREFIHLYLSSFML